MRHACDLIKHYRFDKLEVKYVSSQKRHRCLIEHKLSRHYDLVRILLMIVTFDDSDDAVEFNALQGVSCAIDFRDEVSLLDSAPDETKSLSFRCLEIMIDEFGRAI